MKIHELPSKKVFIVTALHVNGHLPFGTQEGK